MKGACALLDAGMGGGVLQQLALEGNQISAHECTALERLARGGSLQLRTRPEERFEEDFEELSAVAMKENTLKKTMKQMKLDWAGGEDESTPICLDTAPYPRSIRN